MPIANADFYRGFCGNGLVFVGGVVLKALDAVMIVSGDKLWSPTKSAQIVTDVF